MDPDKYTQVSKEAYTRLVRDNLAIQYLVKLMSFTSITSSQEKWLHDHISERCALLRRKDYNDKRRVKQQEAELKKLK